MTETDIQTKVADSNSSAVAVDPSVDQYQVVHDSVHMVSELETRVMVLYWPTSCCLEVVCHVMGVKEDTVRLYLDYRTLYASVLLSADLVKMKKSKKTHTLDFIFARLALVHDSEDHQKWSLTLKAPKERKPSISGPEGHPIEASNTGTDLAAKILAEESSCKEKEKKRQEHQEELIKFIIERPASISDFDFDLYQRLKHEKSPRVDAELADLPVLSDIQGSKQPGAISNLLGKVWLDTSVAQQDNLGTGSNVTSPKNGVAPGTTHETSFRRVSRENSLGSITSLPKIDNATTHMESAVMQSASVTALHPTSHHNKGEKHIYDFLTPGVTRASMAGDTNDSSSVHLPSIRGSVAGNEEDMRKAIKALADDLKPPPINIETPETNTTLVPVEQSSMKGSNRIRRRSLGSAITPVKMAVAMNNSVRRRAGGTDSEPSATSNSNDVSTRGRSLRRSFGMEPLQNIPMNPPNQLPPLTKGNSNKSLHSVAPGGGNNILLNSALPISSTL